ncbi:MAG: hypothetical protein R2747_18085 [Pyrinomonadaceae bacterium]
MPNEELKCRQCDSREVFIDAGYGWFCSQGCRVEFLRTFCDWVQDDRNSIDPVEIAERSVIGDQKFDLMAL